MPISVVMSARNEERYIGEAIDSVRRQSFGDFEFIIVDDGSTDGTAAILRELAAQDARIRVLRQPALGLVAGLNNGIGSASHELIARLDADDLMTRSRLERQVGFMQAHPEISVVGSWVHIVDGEGRDIGRSCPDVDVERGIRERQPRLFVRLVHTSVMLRRSAVLAAGGYREGYVPREDRELWGRLVTAGHKLAVHPEFLTRYRRRPGSLSTAAATMWQAQQLEDMIDANILRRLDGQPELSAEEYRHALAQMSRWRQLDRARVTASRVYFQRAMNRYSTREWIPCLSNLGIAGLLQPVVAVKRLKSALRGELY